jgi:hypothetical protein
VSKLDLESPGSGGYSCTFQYVSHDGGAHWSHPSFPWPDQHLADLGGGTNGFPVQAQGTTLFAAVTGDLDGVAYDGVRLVASEDGGSTWTAVDNTIYAAGQVVTSYIAIPGTTSLYAMSVPQQTLYGQEGQAELWSSNDAGTHWTQVGLAPAGLAPAAQAKLTGTTRTPGGTTLYALDAGDSPVPVFTSRNGGRTWVQVSSAGWPSGQDAYPWSPTTLADGSLLLQFFEAPPIGDPEILASNANISFYGWRPGDTTWFPVTPRPGSRSLDEAWLTSPANGSQSIWIVVRSLSQGARSIAYTVLQCVLH